MRGLENRRLLVVEDEYLLADDLREALESAGAEVVGPAATEAQALDFLAQHPLPDAAVVDINLGGRQISELAARLKAHNIPFVLATGYGAEIGNAELAGAPRWEKPYDPHALAKALPTIIF